MAKKRNLALDYVVYVVVRVVVFLLQSAPLSAGYSFAEFVAVVAHRFDKRHRRVARENLARAFPGQYTSKQLDRMVFEVYRHFAKVVVEIVHIPRMLNVDTWRRYIQVENTGPAVNAFLDRRPVVLVTGHFGNWEMAGVLISALGMRSFAIARDLDNPFLHRFLLKFREWSGQTILSKTGDFDRIQDVLQQRGILVSVADQSAGPRGFFVDFFGRPASTHKAVAVLAMRFDAPIVVGYAFRVGEQFRYRVGCSKVFDPRDYAELKDGAFQLTQDFTAALEAAVRRAPCQYLWLHNRYKHEPKRPVQTSHAVAA